MTAPNTLDALRELIAEQIHEVQRSMAIIPPWNLLGETSKDRTRAWADHFFMPLIEQHVRASEAAVTGLIEAAQSWHDFHHGSDCVQCDEICEALAKISALAAPSQSPIPPVRAVTDADVEMQKGMKQSYDKWASQSKEEK